LAQSDPPTPQSDLYSLGVILQCMTTNGDISRNVPDDLLPSLFALDPRGRVANQSNVQRAHRGARPLLWDPRWHLRRVWIGHALGLGLTAVVSSWAGSSLASMRLKFELPFVPGAGMLHFSLIFDSYPGAAHYRVEYRSKETERWSLISEDSNYCGGLYERPVDQILLRQWLSRTKSVPFRIGIMYERSASS
jgi:hypothetical protein